MLISTAKVSLKSAVSYLL